MQANPYLYFNGNCEAALKFYEKHLGGKIESSMTFEGSPAAEQTSPEWRSKIIHARMSLGDHILMASDAPPGRYNAPQGFALSLGFATPAEAERVFHALSEKGSVQMPLGETFFASRFGMLVDQFGIPWMVLCQPAA